MKHADKDTFFPLCACFMNLIQRLYTNEKQSKIPCYLYLDSSQDVHLFTGTLEGITLM
jgi:hypothetical protein